MERRTPFPSGERVFALSLTVPALPGTVFRLSYRPSGALHSVKPPGDESPLRNVIGKFRGK